MLRTIPPECPVCGCCVDQRDYAERRVAGHLDRFLYCEFCGMGWESSEYPDGEKFVLDYKARTEPRCFAAFMERLNAARAA